jgi:hypothetical protein
MDLTIRERDTERNLLHLAAIKGFVFLGSWLLKNGASTVVNAQDAAGSTPLHYASFYHRAEFVGLLLREGADPLSANDDMQLPVDLTSDPMLRSALSPPSLQSSLSRESSSSMLSSIRELSSSAVELASVCDHLPPATATVPAQTAGVPEKPAVIEIAPPPPPMATGFAARLPRFLRVHVRQLITVTVLAIVGFAMVSAMLIRPQGFVHRTMTNRTIASSGIVDPLPGSSHTMNVVLRIISIIAISIALIVNIFVYAKSQQSARVVVFAMLLIMLDVYQIVAAIVLL